MTPPDHQQDCPWMDGEPACSCPDLPFVPTGCDCDAIDGDHSGPCAIYVQRLAEGADERRKVPGVPDDLDALRARGAPDA